MELSLRALPDRLIRVVSRQRGAGCEVVALTRIKSAIARLVSVRAQLNLFSVEHIDVFGVTRDGREVMERIAKGKRRLAKSRP